MVGFKHSAILVRLATALGVSYPIAFLLIFYQPAVPVLGLLIFVAVLLAPITYVMLPHVVPAASGIRRMFCVVATAVGAVIAVSVFLYPPAFEGHLIARFHRYAAMVAFTAVIVCPLDLLSCSVQRHLSAKKNG